MSRELKVRGHFSNGLIDVRDANDPDYTALFTPEDWAAIEAADDAGAEATRLQKAQEPGWEAAERTKEMNLVRENPPHGG